MAENENVPQVMHALLNDGDLPLVDGAFYETLCGISWMHRELSPEQIRVRFVCAMCHERQVYELLDSITDLQNQVDGIHAWAKGERPQP